MAWIRGRESKPDFDARTTGQVCLLVSATSTGGVDQSALSGGCGGGGGAVVMRSEPSEMVASNPAAFGIIQSLLAECTPPVEAVCLQVIFYVKYKRTGRRFRGGGDSG